MNKWLVVIVSSCIALGGLFIIEHGRFYDGKVHVIFCNVGQGDAIFIRTPGGKNILIDGGPDKSVLSCLAGHMPFWDRTIHELILSHPHQDHYFGMFYVIDRYHTLMFDTEDLLNNTAVFKDLSAEIREKKIPVRALFAGDKLSTPDGLTIKVISPSREYLDRVSPNRIIAERGEQAALISIITYGNFDILLTSDNQSDIISGALKLLTNEIEVLQVPHHGSKAGLNGAILDNLDPAAAVISVGKNNYGHPSKEILKLLRDREVKIFRTDEAGDIEIVSDGKNFSY